MLKCDMLKCDMHALLSWQGRERAKSHWHDVASGQARGGWGAGERGAVLASRKPKYSSLGPGHPHQCTTPSSAP